MSTIVIADDDLITVKNIFNNIMRKNKNAKVVGLTSDGSEVLEYVEKYMPDILLLDLVMPKMNGVEVLDKLIENKEKYLKKMKIIIISSYIDKLYEENKYREYIYDVLPKPYDTDKLLHTIERISAEDNKIRISEYIDRELNKFNFNKNTNSFRYLKDAICQIICEEKINFELENDIYIKVAHMNNKKSGSTIKWDIEKLMNQMYINTKYTGVKEYFNLTEDTKLTTKLFIREIARRYNKN